jgi:hypothetical protein
MDMTLLKRNRTLLLICLVFFIFLNISAVFADEMRVVSVTPNRGAVDQNTPITIKGINFVKPTGSNTLEVYIDGKAVVGLTFIDSRTLKALTPIGNLEEGETERSCDVRVVQKVNNVQQESVLENGFTYVLPGSSPKITEVYDRELFCQEQGKAVNSGPLEGGNDVVIVGTDFRSEGSVVSAVYFGKGTEWIEAKVKEVISINPGQVPNYESGLPGYVKGQKETAIIAVAPPGTDTGSVDVRVVNPDLGSFTSRNGWIYKTCNLSITGITPEYASVTGEVYAVISGGNFLEDATVWVKFVHKNEDGTTGATTEVERHRIRNVTNTEIEFILPPSQDGVKDVVVYNRFGQRVLENGFTYLPPLSQPSIDSVSPSQGTAKGGDEILISGRGFISGSTVTIGGKEAQVLLDASDWYNLRVITPPGTPGPCDVKVTNPDGAFDILTGGFTYVSYPVVDSVTPSVVNTAGGSIVVISGEQFYPNARVFFRGGGKLTRSPEVRVVDLNTVYARIPAVEATGHYDVIVRNADYDPDTGLGQAVLKNGVLFEDPPEVSPSVKSIYPNRGPTTGGTQAVVVCDENAAPDAQIFIGLEETQVQEYLGGGRFRVIIPPNEEGDYKVTVTNPDGGTGVSKDAIFQYRVPSTEMKITSITPNTGSTEGGTYVTIRGTDFRSGAEVYFGSNEAENVTVTLEDAASKTYKITCYTPEGELGFVDVAVINPDNSFGIAIVEDGFEYRKPASQPEITSVMPVSGPTTGGTKITVKGKDFRTGLRLYLDGLPASDVVLVDSEIITAVTPAHGPGKTCVTVVNYDGGSFTYGDEEQETGFTYAVAGSSPKVDSVEPGFGPAGKTTWTTITGLDFRVNAKVYFGAVEAPVVEYKDYKTLRALAPAQEAGTVDVTVVNEDFGTGTLKGGFTYRSSAPEILSVNPNSGSRAGGDKITIFGREFVVEYLGGSLSVAPAVYFEQGELSVEAEVRTGSTTEELFIVTPPAPNGVIGFYDVRVVNHDGAKAVLKDGFKYLAPDSKPEISMIEPASGTVLGGTPIKIYGKDFRDDALVFIGGKEATGVQVVDDTTIKAVTPAHSPGSKDVTIVNYDGGSFTLEQGFTYMTPLSEPQITSVSPNKGPQTGGTVITVTGRDFREGVQVYVGGELCHDIIFVNYKTITAVTPGGEPGPADVTVVNDDMGSFTLKNGFTFIYVELPVIGRVTPNQGPSEGGTEITIIGDNFAKGVSVKIGGRDADILNVTANEIRAVTPPGEVGWQDVAVTNPDGGKAVLERGFEYKRSRTVPDTPGALEATPVDKFTIKLEWDTSEFANYFEIYVRERGEDNYRFVDQTKSNVNVYYVTGLEPGTTYYFQVRAVNELGLSGFSATDSARTKSGSSRTEADEEREEIEENVQVILGQGSVTFAASTRTALRDCSYTFDFTDALSQKNPVKIVQINGDVAEDIDREVGIILPGCRISIPSALWNLPALNSLSSREKREAVVRVILTDAGQREAESALAYLPYGAKVISRVYSLQLEVVSRGKSEAVGLFSYPVNITLDVPAGYMLRNAAVYSRNLYGTWAKAPGSTVTLSTARAYTYNSTTFLLASF